MFLAYLVIRTPDGLLEVAEDPVEPAQIFRRLLGVDFHRMVPHKFLETEMAFAVMVKREASEST